MPDCRTVAELVTAYLERDLTWSDWLRLQYHLGLCGDCRAHLWQMRATVRYLASVEPEPPPDGIPERLLQVLREIRM